MTEDEKRQQKALLLLEYHEAMENIAHLREKAGHVGKPVEEVATWLLYASPERGPYINIETNKKRDAQIRVNLEAYRKAMNFDELLSLMDEIEKADKLVEQLKIRKAELGLK